MKHNSMRRVALTIPADRMLVPLTLAFAEESSAAFGLDRAGALALTLATEEIVGYFCRTHSAAKEIQLHIREGLYYVEAEFLLPDQNFDVSAFNLTARAYVETESGLGHTGLMIASRMVDRLSFSVLKDNISLKVVKEKRYPEITAETPEGQPIPLKDFHIRPPEPEELKAFFRRTEAFYDAAMHPVFFHFPGKGVDMVASGQWEALIAVDTSGNVGGGIFIHMGQTPMVEAAGPYLFAQPKASAMAKALIEGCIASIARKGRTGLVIRYATREIPDGYFEVLGTLDLRAGDGKTHPYPSYYRQITEDFGAAVWCHPDLAEFLSLEYKRLTLPRQISETSESGETESHFSVIFVALDNLHGTAVLHPVWWGMDAERNLTDHLAFLKKESFSTILFAMDLGTPWKVRFTPFLLQNGFEPRMVIPYGGSSDLVLFQHVEEGGPP